MTKGVRKRCATQADQRSMASSMLQKWALTRSDDGGNNRTRTCDPLFVRQRQYVRHRPRWCVPASQRDFSFSVHHSGPSRTTLRGYTPGYISRPRREAPKID